MSTPSLSHHHPSQEHSAFHHRSASTGAGFNMHHNGSSAIAQQQFVSHQQQHSFQHTSQSQVYTSNGTTTLQQNHTTTRLDRTTTTTQQQRPPQQSIFQHTQQRIHHPSPFTLPTHTPILPNPGTNPTHKLSRIKIKKDSYFTISNRFRDLKFIGEGSYGMVCSAFDTVSNERVAIKKISGIFSNVVLQSRPELIPKRILREIHILRNFSHENIIQLRYIERPLARNFDEIYIVMDLMETDLDRIIQSNQEINERHIQFFMYQILKAVAYIHSAGILHRDIKPSNVLINLDGKIKLCDLGLAVKEHTGMNTVVVTRWYRAPELLLTNPRVYKVTQYSKPVDLWSVGCIMVELMAREPSFPGKDHFDQLEKIVQVLGYNTCVNAVREMIHSGRGVIGNDEQMLRHRRSSSNLVRPPQANETQQQQSEAPQQQSTALQKQKENGRHRHSNGYKNPHNVTVNTQLPPQHISPEISPHVTPTITTPTTPANPDVLILSDVALANLTKEELKHHKGVVWREIFPNFSPQAIDLLDRLLQFDPAKRISAADALRHPFFANLPQDIPNANLELDFSYEIRDLTVEDYKRLIFREICKFHPMTSTGLDSVCRKQLSTFIHQQDLAQNTKYNAKTTGVSTAGTDYYDMYDESSTDDDDYYDEDEEMDVDSDEDVE